MRGKPAYNAFAFTEARTHLRNSGYAVYCPSEADRRTGGDDEDLPLAEYMARDLPHVCRADAVVVLPGWEESKGASIEVAVADMLSKPVYEWPELERV